MVSFNLKVLAKFGLCSNCSQKLDGCSLARARKIFATACQLLVLAKINTLLACSQMLARTILYPFICDVGFFHMTIEAKKLLKTNQLIV